MNFNKELERADILYDQNNFEQAKELYQSIMLKNSDPNATLMYGNCLSELNEHEMAIEIFKKLTEINPYDEAPWYNLGCEYLGLDQPAKALKYFQKAFEVDRANADAYYKAGFCYQCLDNIEQAIVHYKRSLEFEVSEKSLFRLGISYMKKEMEGKALEFLLRANEIDSDHYDTNFYIGLCYEILKNPHKAIEYYNKALKLENNFDAHLNLGVCYREIGDFTSALKHSKAAYKLEPNDSDTLFNYCLALIKSKKGNEAYKLLCSTDVNFDEDYSLLEMLIVLSLNRGDFSRADEAYIKLKKVDKEKTFDYETLKEKFRKKSDEK